VLTPTCNVGFAPGLCQVAGSGLDLGSLSGAPGTYVNDFNSSTGGGFDGIPDIEYAEVAVPSTTAGNQYNGRIDFAASTRDTFAVSTYVSSLNQLSADSFTGSQPMADVNIQPLNSVTTLLWTHTLSPNILNQARANVTRYAFNQVASNANQVNWGIPRIEVQGFPFGRIEIGAAEAPNTPGIEAENTIDFDDTLSHVHGNKVFKYGVDIIKEQSNNNLLGSARPDGSSSISGTCPTTPPFTRASRPLPLPELPVPPSAISAPAITRCSSSSTGNFDPTLR
jgi:hypothetical protein